MDSRPSELDPYPRTERDLGSAVLWQRSIHRSQRRRLRQREARRNAPRQKGASLAAGAAILASPVLTPLIGAATASSARPGATKAEVANKAAISGEKTWLLSYGDTGEAVAAVQAQLRIPADGIFGPQTEGAVKTFQINQGLAATGIVDARTWAEIFGSKVLFYGEADASASSTGAAESVRVVLGDDDEEPAGGPDLGERVELRDDIEAAEAEAPAEAPAEAAPPAPEPAPEPQAQSVPVSTGDGCTSGGRMVAPVNGTVTGSFGEDRGDHAHSGTDIAAPTGTTVRAAECGTVSMSGTESGYGSMVCIRHAGEATTCYAHLSERSVAVNEYVKAGQKIGEVGCTGSCTGPHVHFEVRQNGVAEDPSAYLEGSRAVAASADSTAIGGATPEEQTMVFGSTGGAEAPAAATATTAVPAEAAPGRRGRAGRGRPGRAARRGRPGRGRAGRGRARARRGRAGRGRAGRGRARALEAAPVEAAPVEAAPGRSGAGRGRARRAAPVEAAPRPSRPRRPVEAAPAPVEAAPGRGSRRAGRSGAS